MVPYFLSGLSEFLYHFIDEQVDMTQVEYEEIEADANGDLAYYI